MKRYFCLVAYVAVLANTACRKDSGTCPCEDVTPAQPIELTAMQYEKVSGDNAFAFHLFRQVVASDRGTNPFVSPLSVAVAMGMLYNGASGDARTEIAEALGMSGFADGEINAYYQKMSQALAGIDPLTTLLIANSIWLREGYPVKQSFLDVNRQHYGAEVRGLDFNVPASVDVINRWCAEKTGNRIDRILDEIPGEAVMYLINAVYFKSKWQFRFDGKNTQPAKFTLRDGSQADVHMMEQTAGLSYYADDMLQCVELPYGNSAFGMVALLPQEGRDMESIVEYLDRKNWEKISAGLHAANIRLKFPRFRQECEFELNEPVMQTGIVSIFARGYLKGVADDDRLQVSRIKHKTFVEVNEDGTEAAAVTSVETLTTAVPEPQPAVIPFYADRPFIYLIRERSTGAILFVGRMDHPKE